jgi:GT2 family glycosyltransferase
MGRDVVVVLNFNGRSDTEACVESLVTGSPEALVLVVDNGSYDGAVESVRARWPDVATLQIPENRGFAGGMNAGLRWALDRDAGTVTVLNNDTVVPAGVIEDLAERARHGVAVSPEVRYADGSERVWFGGGEVDRSTNLAHHISTVDLRPTRVDGLRETEILAGCCVTATADTWTAVGLFDERYFLNFEDSDWSLRASERGVALVVDPSAHYYTRNGLLFGRERCAGAWSQSARFLRRHVVPALAQRAREREFRQLIRRAIVVATALHDFARGRFGRAPTWLLRRTARWAERDTG